MSDALASTAGQGVAFAVSLAFSIFVPRALGAANYGEWMLFRGLAFFWLPLLSLGDREVIASFYVPRREKGDHDGAARVFKSLAVARLALLAPGLAAALLMLYFSTSVYRTPSAALCLAATVVFKSMQSSLSTLLFGHRRLGWLAVLEVAQAILLPALVLLSFGDGRVGWIPPAAALADAILFVMALGLSRLRQEWKPGWLKWTELLGITRYAAGVALATSVIVSMNSLLPYLMNLRGYSSTALGWVGLSTRCAWAVQTGLMVVATALMPALAAVQVHHGVQRMFLWQDFLSRLGLSLILWLTGNILLLGPPLAGRIWGDDFAAITPLLSGSLLAVLPVWLGAQWIRQFLLQQQTRVYLQAACLYAAVLGGLFLLLPVDAAGWMPVAALIAAGWILALHTAFHAARHGASLGWLLRFLPAVAWLAAAWYAGGGKPVARGAVGPALIWNAGLAAAILIPGALRLRELADLWLDFRHRPVR